MRNVSPKWFLLLCTTNKNTNILKKISKSFSFTKLTIQYLTNNLFYRVNQYILANKIEILLPVVKIVTLQSNYFITLQSNDKSVLT